MGAMLCFTLQTTDATVLAHVLGTNLTCDCPCQCCSVKSPHGM